MKRDALLGFSFLSIIGYGLFTEAETTLLSTHPSYRRFLTAIIWLSEGHGCWLDGSLKVRDSIYLFIYLLLGSMYTHLGIKTR